MVRELVFMPHSCRSVSPSGSAQVGGKRSLANVAFGLLARRFMHLDTPMLRGVIVARWLLLRTTLMDVPAWPRGLASNVTRRLLAYPEH